jgi:hypothetical protein
MSKENIKQGIADIMANELGSMRDEFSTALTAKAVDALEDRKIELAKDFFSFEPDISEAAFGGEKYKGKDNPNRRKTGDEYLGRAGTHWAKSKARGWLPGKKNVRRSAQHAKASDASMELAYAKGAIPKELMKKARAESEAKKAKNLDEISPEMKKRYVQKAAIDLRSQSYRSGKLDGIYDRVGYPNKKAVEKKIDNRGRGIHRATKE